MRKHTLGWGCTVPRIGFDTEFKEDYHIAMKKFSLTNIKYRQFPIIIEKDEDEFYVAECPLFQGCYSQGKTLDECLKNIREVIELCLEEKENQQMLKSYKPRELSVHTITL